APYAARSSLTGGGRARTAHHARARCARLPRIVTEKPSDLTRRELLRGAAVAMPLAATLATAGRAATPHLASSDASPRNVSEAATGAAAPSPSRRMIPAPRAVVVGAGAFGGWTALHLLRNGAKVTLLD